jgi:hypothetical protein
MCIVSSTFNSSQLSLFEDAPVSRHKQEQNSYYKIVNRVLIIISAIFFFLTLNYPPFIHPKNKNYTPFTHQLFVSMICVENGFVGS